MQKSGRLTLAELKAQKSVIVKIETIKGGNASDCHLGEHAGFWETIGWMIKMNYEAKL